FNAGSFAGPAFCLALIGFLIAAFGWRWAFVISGAIGFIWLVLWVRRFYLARAVARAVQYARARALAVAGRTRHDRARTQQRHASARRGRARWPDAASAVAHAVGHRAHRRLQHLRAVSVSDVAAVV